MLLKTHVKKDILVFGAGVADIFFLEGFLVYLVSVADPRICDPNGLLFMSVFLSVASG